MHGEVLDHLLRGDEAMFSYLNGLAGNEWLDKFMVTITDAKFLFLCFIFCLIFSVAYFLLLRKAKVAFLSGVFLILSLATTDFVAGVVLKRTFKRPRPCHVAKVNLLVGCGRSYSFPSAHAADSMAVAVFMSSLFPHFSLLFTLASLLVGASRVYVGVHYPLDVVFGWLSGALIGAINFLIFRAFAGDKGWRRS